MGKRRGLQADLRTVPPLGSLSFLLSFLLHFNSLSLSFAFPQVKPALHFHSPMSEQEQASEIRRLLDCQHKNSSPFTVLQLDIATCTVGDVNKSFRRIALLLHPDKCKLPHASDAFHVAERVHKSLSQEAVLLHLQRAHQRQKERAEEEGSGGKQSASQKRERDSDGSSGGPRGTGPSPAAPATAAAIPFGQLSQLAPSGLSSDTQKAAEIARLLRCKPTDYFVILDIDPESCEVADVDRRYRKMAQALHPDKCHLPQVADAFQRFERAHKELADEKKLVRFKVGFQQQRKREAALQAEQARRQQQQQHGTTSWMGHDSQSTDLSPEERLELRKKEAIREQQLEAARLADEALRKKQKREVEEAETAKLASELERQRKEWKELDLF